MLCALLQALSRQELRLEVWHKCDRPASTALGNALALRSGPPGETKDVLLGSASCPLAPLLTRAQVGSGLHCF